MEEEEEEEEEEEGEEEGCETAMDVADIVTAVFGHSDSEDEHFHDSGPCCCCSSSSLASSTALSSASPSAILRKALLEDKEEMQWEKIELVEGLWICRSFLSSQQQEVLWTAIQSEGWLLDPRHNQVMRFGELPDWASELALSIRHAITTPNSSRSTCFVKDESLPKPLEHQIVQREPLFNQLAINSYEPGEGILSHVDLMRFEDGIAILSLLSARVMTFAKLPCSKTMNGLENPEKASQCATRSSEIHVESFTKENPIGNAKDELSEEVPVLLLPGDLLVMSGAARYHWMHGIVGDEKHQFWNGRKLEQRRRVSVTLRRLCPERD